MLMVFRLEKKQRWIIEKGKKNANAVPLGKGTAILL